MLEINGIDSRVKYSQETDIQVSHLDPYDLELETIHQLIPSGPQAFSQQNKCGTGNTQTCNMACSNIACTGTCPPLDIAKYLK